MVLKGVIHNKTIELEQQSGLPDGQAVTVLPGEPKATSPTGPEALEALRRAADGWTDDPEGLDRFVEYIRLARKQRSSRDLLHELDQFETEA